jgi:hypothetical protein
MVVSSSFLAVSFQISESVTAQLQIVENQRIPTQLSAAAAPVIGAIGNQDGAQF